MADEGELQLTADAVRYQIESYRKSHPRDLGMSDGKSRIPLKNLMKLFEIKKKCSKERQNLFRGFVNDLCELEMNDDVGKVLVLREKEDVKDVSVENLGYGDAAPEIAVSATKSKRESRLKLPCPSTSGGLSIEIADCAAVRRQYNRRGSVTRYSIVAQNEVVDEYKQHEDIINQFRKDSLKIESSMRNLNHVDDDQVSTKSNSTVESRTSSKQSKGRGKRRQREHQDVRGDGNAIQRFFRRGRLSIAC